MTPHNSATLNQYPQTTQISPQLVHLRETLNTNSLSNHLFNKLKPHIEDFIWQKSLRSRLLLSFSLINRRGFPVPFAVFDKLSALGRFNRELTEDFGSEAFLSNYMIPPQGKCLVDVGASVGLWAIYAVKKGAEVYAFEPCPSAYNLLAKQALNYPKLHTYPYALGDFETTQKMSVLPYDIGAVMNKKPAQRIGAKIIDQTVHTLDSFNIEDVGVLKIDTEGYEVPILRGGQKTLQKNQPLLIIEVHKETGQAEKTFQAELSRIQNQLKAIGYTWKVHYRPVSLREMQPHIIAKPLKPISELEFTIAYPPYETVASTVQS